MGEAIPEPQRALLVSTLEAALADVSAFGRHFYERLFGRHPELRRLFTRAHGDQARRLLQGLLTITRHLSADDELDEFLEALAGVHVGYGVREEHYAWIGENLLAVLSEMVPGWSAEHERAWTFAYALIEEKVRCTLARMEGRSWDRWGILPRRDPIGPLEVAAEHLLLSRYWRGGLPFSEEDLCRWRALRRLIERLLRVPRTCSVTPRRRSLRVPTRLRSSFTAGDQTTVALLTNVSEGGLFVATENPLPAGTPLELEILCSPAEPPVKVAGSVAWSRSETCEHGPPGMGVRLRTSSRQRESVMLGLVQRALYVNLSTSAGPAR